MQIGVVDISSQYDSAAGVRLLRKSMTQHSPIFSLSSKDTLTNKNQQVGFVGFIRTTFPNIGTLRFSKQLFRPIRVFLIGILSVLLLGTRRKIGASVEPRVSLLCFSGPEFWSGQIIHLVVRSAAGRVRVVWNCVAIGSCALGRLLSCLHRRSCKN